MENTFKLAMGVCCCLQTCNSALSDGVSTRAKFDCHIYVSPLSCYMPKYLPFIMYYGSALLMFICEVHCLKQLNT